MSLSGKKIRLQRFNKRGAGIVVPIDHGLTIGPVAGLGSIREIAGWIGSRAIDGVIAHKGIVERLGERGLLAGRGVMLHVNGMSTLGGKPDTKEVLTSVAVAMRLGADAVSLQTNFDGENDAHNLRMLGAVVDEAQGYGMPVLAMVYDKVTASSADARIARIRHLMRVAMELGIDAIKIGAPAEMSEVPEILEGIADDMPVYFAGGSRGEPAEILRLASLAVRCGGAGLCVGRNVFQQPDPGAVLASLRAEMDAALAERRPELAAPVAPPSSSPRRRSFLSVPRSPISSAHLEADERDGRDALRNGTA